MTKTSRPDRLAFLPGVTGNADFWKPVAQLLSYKCEQLHYGWPGHWLKPPGKFVKSLDDLVANINAGIDKPTAIVAQSMGGIVAIRLALEKPGLVTHLVLTATSGGIETSELGAQDWRESFHAANPAYPRWFADYAEDLSEQIRKIDIPVLLIWGDSDPISPVAVGQRLASLFPNSQLCIIPQANHDLANAFPDTVARLIDQFLLE